MNIYNSYLIQNTLYNAFEIGGGGDGKNNKEYKSNPFCNRYFL